MVFRPVQAYSPTMAMSSSLNGRLLSLLPRPLLQQLHRNQRGSLSRQPRSREHFFGGESGEERGEFEKGGVESEGCDGGRNEDVE